MSRSELVTNATDIKALRDAGGITKIIKQELFTFIQPGISTWDINEYVAQRLKDLGGAPSFLNYRGFPAVACISYNDRVVHAIPRREDVLTSGDIVGVDMGVMVNGWHVDTAYTYRVGTVTPTVEQFLQRVEGALQAGIWMAVVGNRVGDISAAIQKYITPYGYGIVRELTGHGVGRQIHEDPFIPNYGKPHTGEWLQAGQTLAIEPIINLGKPDIQLLDDGWTVVTADGKWSGHFEETILVQEGESEILTGL